MNGMLIRKDTEPNKPDGSDVPVDHFTNPRGGIRSSTKGQGAPPFASPKQEQQLRVELVLLSHVLEPVIFDETEPQLV
jgi:hypothetical protein